MAERELGHLRSESTLNPPQDLISEAFVNLHEARLQEASMEEAKARVPGLSMKIDEMIGEVPVQKEGSAYGGYSEIRTR